MKKLLCLICCRGGSKGIPGKNIKKFAGKPLLHWTLEHAMGAKIFDEIFVSTDSKEIAKCAEDKGISIPFLRPDEFATDNADQMLTHKHVFDKLDITDRSHRVCILLNNPFIDINVIIDSHKLAVADDFTHLTIDCAKIDGDYLYFRQMEKEGGLLKLRFSDAYQNSGSNRQTLETSFSPINNVIWGKPSHLNDRQHFKKKIILEGINPYFLCKTKNFDLDDQNDWLIAEAVMQSFISKRTRY